MEGDGLTIFLTRSDSQFIKVSNSLGERALHSGTKTRPRDHRSESAGAQPERQAQTWCREAAPPAQSLSLAGPGCATLSQVAWETVATSSCSWIGNLLFAFSDRPMILEWKKIKLN